MESVIESLTGAGYARCEQVEGTGQYAARGGILDFFPPGNDYPVRIEFWGDSIDTMAIFDAEDQRRIDNIDEISILPATETVFDSPAQLAGMLKSFTEGLRGRNAAFKKSVAGDIERLENGVSLSSYDRYLPIIYQRAATLFDYAEDALVFVCESASVEEHLRNFCTNQNEAVKHAFEDGLLCSGLDVFWMDSSELPSVLEDRGAVIMDNFPRGSYPVKLRLNEYIQCGQFSSWSGGIAGLAEDLDQGAGETSVVMAGTPKAALSLCNDLYDGGFNAVLHRKNPESFTAGAVNVISGTLSSGFSYPSVKFRLISYGGRHSAQPSKLRKRRRKAAEIFNSLEELRRGDYVVHAAHGIGIFTGINKIEFDGVTKDYITIKYAGDDVLYVPVTQLDLVSKYIGASDNSERHIKLHKLGSQQWQKTRSRVRSAVKDIARELTELYRERMRTKGYAFSPDCDMQADLKAGLSLTRQRISSDA